MSRSPSERFQRAHHRRSQARTVLSCAAAFAGLWLVPAVGLAVAFPSVPSLPAQGSVSFEFQVTIDDPLEVDALEVCNQATVTADGGISITSDDPTTPTAGDETCTKLEPFDFGDAPDPTYPTLLASDGARHSLGDGSGTLFLGATVDAEANGQPNATSTGDDIDAEGNDDDGIVITQLVPAGTAMVTATASGTGRLDGWIDWNGDGDWNDLDEKVVDDVAVVAGPNVLPISVPASAAAGSFTAARFRLSTAGGLDPTGEAADGEVEDYRVLIESASIAVTKVATPDVVAEAGGNVTFEIGVTNTGTLPVDLTSLVDDIHGDLDGQGTCSVPQTIAASGSYFCTFTVAVGCTNAGDSETDTVTASGTAGGAAVSAMAMETVTCGDDAPTVTVTKAASPSSLAEPGGTVSYTVAITNTSGSSDPVTVTALADDLAGDLAGQGTCSVPQTIAPGATYACTFDDDVTGNAGVTVTNTVTATFEDDDGVGTDDTATAMEDVSITGAAPSITVTKTADPTEVVEPGDTVTYTIEIENTSVSTDPVTLDTFTDDQTAALGTCTTPQTIAPGATFSCSYDVLVTGMPGDEIVNTFTASGTDDEEAPVSGSDQATVTVLSADDIPPTVDASIDGTALVDCEQFARGGQSAIDLVFDEPVVGADDPANYRLVQPGADGEFDTVDCSSTGDDVVIPFTVDAASDTMVTLRSISSRFPGGRYQLVACESIEDLAGNALDGDGDGIEGGAYLRDFRLDPDNLFVNGHLDCELAPWSTTGGFDWSPVDVDGSAESGSALAEMVPVSSMDDASETSVCVPVSPGSVTEANPYRFEAEARVDADPGQQLTLTLTCEFIDAPSCGALPSDEAQLEFFLSDTAGTWVSVGLDLEVPETAESAICGVAANSLDGTEPLADLYVDRLYLLGDGEIFSDGFESGDTLEWSTEVP